MYGTETNTLTEFLALQEGLLLCGSLQLPCVRIESDSAVVVQAIRKGKINNWMPFYVVRVLILIFTWVPY